MYKIYSRKRFIIKPWNKNRNAGAGQPVKIKIIKIIILLFVIIVILKIFFNYIDPVFQALCEDKLKSMATIITNQESTKIMNKYQYDELYTIETDETGNISVIKSNVVPINNMISDLTENIQNEFDKIQESKIYIPIGSLTGSYLLSSSGPSIPIKISMLGTLDTEIKSEFISQGINQTLHRVYVNFYCEMKIVTPINTYIKNITNQVIIAEHIIVGNIPDTYYNLDGIKDSNETLNLIN